MQAVAGVRPRAESDGAWIFVGLATAAALGLLIVYLVTTPGVNGSIVRTALGTGVITILGSLLFAANGHFSARQFALAMLVLAVTLFVAFDGYERERTARLEERNQQVQRDARHQREHDELRRLLEEINVRLRQLQGGRLTSKQLASSKPSTKPAMPAAQPANAGSSTNRQRELRARAGIVVGRVISSTTTADFLHEAYRSGFAQGCAALWAGSTDGWLYDGIRGYNERHCRALKSSLLTIPVTTWRGAYCSGYEHAIRAAFALSSTGRLCAADGRCWFLASR